MEKIKKPKISEIETLKIHEEKLKNWCEIKKEWQSSGMIYKLLRDELSKLTNEHCSFCDGFPLNDTSKETIEHYFPKKMFPEKTYEWENLFYCCDKCQSFANSHNPFVYTLKPDDESYKFDEYFYFNPQSGEVIVLEYLKNIDFNKYQNATNFLERYGINKSEQRLEARKRDYNQLIHNFVTNFPKERDETNNRYVFDEALRFFKSYNKI